MIDTRRARRSALWASALALMAASGSAMATDLAQPALHTPVPAPSWTGFHIGINAGGFTSRDTSDFLFNGGFALGAAPNRISGPFGGVQAGYDWQTGQLVFGVEADFQFAGGDGTLAASSPCLCDGLVAARFSQNLAWFGTARARIGYGTENWLAYVTGGYAAAKVETDAMASAVVATAHAGWSMIHSGWALGGGLEVLLAPNWSARVEGLHMRFSESHKSWTPLPGATITDSSHLRVNLVRAGVNYRF